MPGRTPYEAVDSFLQPLKNALGCVSHAHLGAKQKGGFVPGREYTWNLNAGSGARLRHGLLLYASMRWQIIDNDRDNTGRYRVTTLGYMYELESDESQQLWALHWHPTGSSPVKQPHLHVPPDAARAMGLPERHHLPTDRWSFEKAIRWCIASGADPLCPDWDARLWESEAPHVLHRTWSDPLSLAARDSKS